MKQFILVFALLILASVAAAQENFLISPTIDAGGAQPEINKAAAELNNQGVQKALKDRNYEAATDLFRTAVQSDERCLQCRYNLGAALAQREKYDEAATVFNALISFNPNYASGFAGMAEVYHKRGLAKESAAAYEKAVELEPGDTTLQSNFGNALYQIGEYEKALKHLNRAAELNPSRAGAYSNRGAVLLALGRTKEAVKDLRRAISMSPSLPEAQNNLGVALSSLGREKEALQYYLEALRLRPNWNRVRYNLTLNYLELGQREKAREHLAALKEIDSTLAKNAEKVFYAKFLVDARMR